MSTLEQHIPEGYKQTEVGIIPSDWSVKAFGQVMCIRHGKDQKTVQVLDGCYPIFGTGGKMGTTNTYLYDKPSVLIGRKGTINKPRYIDKPFWTVDTLFYSEVSNKESAKFIYYKFCMIDWIQYNEASGVPSLNASTIESVSASFPKLKEQTAIANVLSDVDALLAELEKLSAKKQAIKNATMQQLLTGKTRLPQFATYTEGEKLGQPKGTKASELGEVPEDWDVVSLGDIGSTVIGLTYSPNDVADYGTLVLRSSNIQKNTLAYENNVFVDMDLPGRVIVKEGDILVCVRNGSRNLIGKCALIDKNAEGSAFGAFMSIYRTKQSKFIFFQFQSNVIQNQINEIMGATINQITNKDMAGFKVPLPRDEEEQTAIATILSDMDSEIQTLEQRLAKTRQIKQGMMQELLTGRTRLPFDKEN
ncbi:restriction endonuclease [Vibrio lentus]|uniref:restriction endonuclease subunit S n=1 Tax=Vibrio lentus TaxID=136468 RepID=UPI000CC39865|nr:restriction endonuclease subunit S [Vibrio lentus]PMN51749.1 restriction endonuclease [Vibrio lentus]